MCLTNQPLKKKGTNFTLELELYFEIPENGKWVLKYFYYFFKFIYFLKSLAYI